ncbi:MAG: ceramidase domain-containing protein [Dongiaceae bacterium]
MPLACPSVIAGLSPGLCQAVDHYCERTDPSFWSEPVNALTNAAFLLAAWLAWRQLAGRPGAAGDGTIRALILALAAVGPGSFLFHTLATRWAEWGDVIPILLFMLIYLWLLLGRLLGVPPWPRAGALAVFLAATVYLEAAVPGAVLWGGALYLPTLLVLIGACLALRRRQAGAARAMAGATGVFLLSFAARTLDAPVCPAFPLGSHFLWHLLNAALLYLLTRLVILYARPAAA